MNIEKEREAFEAWAFQNIENFIDVQRDREYYVMNPSSRLKQREKEFLVLSSNRGWASWQASALRAEAKHDEDFDTFFEKRHGGLPLDTTTEEYANKSYLKHEMKKTWEMATAQLKGCVVVPVRSDNEIIDQTIDLMDLLATSTNRFQRDPDCLFPFESSNPRVKEWWYVACQIQELLTNTDPTNCDFDEYKADVEAARGGK